MNYRDHLINTRDTNATQIGRDLTEEIFEIFNGLESVIEDINRFVHDSCDRLERLCPVHPTVENRSHETDRLAKEMEDWEDKRSLVEQKIREQVDLLAEAWLRLEAEQRSLLQMKEGLAFDPTRAAKGATGISIGTRLQTVPGKVPPPIQPSAIHEFEKLRQEIESIRPSKNVMRD